MARKSATGPLSPRGSGGAGPADPMAANARGIILIVIALILGVFILNKTQAGGAATSGSSQPRTTTTKAAKGGPTTTPTTIRAAQPPAAIKVLAANGSGVAGLGSKTSARLTAGGYNSLAPTNTTTDVATSVVEFAPGFDVEAVILAVTLGLQPTTAVKPLAADVPVEDTKSADIVVLVGPDLDATAPAAGITTPTTAFSVTTTVAR